MREGGSETGGSERKSVRGSGCKGKRGKGYEM